MVTYTPSVATSPEALAARAAGDELDVLYILGPGSPETWMQRALGNETDQIRVTESPALSVALEQLRKQAFDVIVIDRGASDRNAGEVLMAIRANTYEQQPVVVLSERADRDDAADFLMAGATAFLSLRVTTPREFVWQLQAAAAHGRWQREHQQLRAWQQRQIEQEQHEILGLLEEQSTVFGIAARLDDEAQASAGTALRHLPELAVSCRDLLQAYVVMGRGHLGREVERFAVELHNSQTPLARVLQAFTQAIQALVRDRGARSSRHVYNRGNLLLFDLLLRWSDLPPRKETHEPVRHHSDLQRTRQPAPPLPRINGCLKAARD